MTLKDYEDKIAEYIEAEEDIALYGYCYINGKRFEREELPRIREAKEVCERRVKELLNETLTIEKCQRMILLCRDAEEKVLEGKECELEGKHLTRSDLSEILFLKKHYETELERIKAGLEKGRYAYRIMPYE